MQTKRGWTLIELLVVIAIIAVLVGIVYALMAYAIERTHQAQCISNLHQIGVALKLYIEDYKQADWETEVRSIDCDRIDEKASEILIAHWGFPDTLLQLVSAGYLKGGEKVLHCRSVHPRLAEGRVHYFYQIPLNYQLDLPVNYPLPLCQLKTRMHQYPIVVDINHWRGGRGGVYLILRLNDQVETRRFGSLGIDDGLNL
jgi:prepilin-type N-terminal cleavage/methylation domain-containing protein